MGNIDLSDNNALALQQHTHQSMQNFNSQQHIGECAKLPSNFRNPLIPQLQPNNRHVQSTNGCKVKGEYMTTNGQQMPCINKGNVNVDDESRTDAAWNAYANECKYEYDNVQWQDAKYTNAATSAHANATQC